MADEPTPPTVADISDAIRSGRTSASEQLAGAARRWEATHDWLNALVQPRFDAAAEEARGTPANDPRPLAGVPVSVKDCFSLEGLGTTLGILPRATLRDQHDCELVQQLRRAGAVLVGKSNVPQALYLHETDNPVFGRTVNPWQRERGPGGSSGGDAAAVAAGVVPLAFGNDLAGSIRQPAHACGLVGYLPGTTFLGGGGAFNTMPALRGVRSRVGVLARSVADAVHAVEAVSGRSLTPVDPRAPLPSVGWWETAGPVSASPAVVRGVAEAVEAIQAAGIHTRRVDETLAELAGWLHLGLVSGDGGRSIRGLLAGSSPIAQVGELIRIAALPKWQRPLVAGIAGLVGRGIESEAVRKTGPLTAGEAAVLLRARDALAGILQEWRQTQGIDAVVCPVSALPALRHETAGRLVLAAFPCLFASLFDLPAAAVPVTTVHERETRSRRVSLDPVLRAAAFTDTGSAGLPIGVQIVAVDGREETLLRVMTAVERGAGPLLLPAERLVDQS